MEASSEQLKVTAPGVRWPRVEREARVAPVRFRWLPPLAIAGLAFAYQMANPLALGHVDESHLMLEARRVLDGQAPYRDFFESLTPLSLYLFAAVYAVTGTTLLATRAVIALVLSVGAALLWRLTRRVAGAPEAAVVTLAFVALCVPVWPIASPHWISTTLALAAAVVTLGERWQGSARGRPFLAGVLGGLAVCNQQQRGFFLALWLPLALLVLSASLPRPHRWRRLAGALGWSAAGGALVIVGILGHAAWRASLGEMVDMIFLFAIRQYASAQTGQHGWAEQQPLTGTYAAATWVWLMRIAPLFVVAEGALLLRRIRRRWRRTELEEAALCLLAVLMALSVGYLPDFIHVAFILPFLLLPAAALLYRLRTAPLWDRLPAGRAAVTAAVVLLGVALAVKGMATLGASRARALVPIESGLGTIRGSPHMEQLLAAVRRHLIAEPSGRSSLYSYPIDAWLYLAVPADNPSPYSLLLPGMFREEDYQRVLAMLRARRPGTVVLSAPFLRGPEAERIQDAVDAGYDLAEEIEPFRIYVRRAPPAADAAR